MERHPLAEARGESVQAPTTNLPSNDPWRDEESPQTPKTPRLVLECEKPRSAQGHAGKHITGCEFSVVQTLLALVVVQAKSGIRERCSQKNAWLCGAEHGTACVCSLHVLLMR